MAAKKKTKLQQKIDAVKAKSHQWTFEVKGKYNPDGNSDFLGKIKDENGKTVLIIQEDADYNQLSRLLKTSKYLQKPEDMKGLAAYVWDRNLLPMEPEEKEEWKKKKIIPIDIRLVSVV